MEPGGLFVFPSPKSRSAGPGRLAAGNLDAAILEGDLLLLLVVSGEGGGLRSREETGKPGLGSGQGSGFGPDGFECRPDSRGLVGGSASLVGIGKTGNPVIICFQNMTNAHISIILPGPPVRSGGLEADRHRAEDSEMTSRK